MSRSQPKEVDLHGLNIEKALTRFSEVYNQAALVGSRPRLVVIHGWNASDFRHSIASALHRLLKQRAIEFEYPFEGNRGRTCVHVRSATDAKKAKARPKGISSKEPRSLRGGL
jgi:hypothetical protein